MDQYPGYREPALARSPPERTNWGGRDEGYRDRASDRAEPRDNFYRGRSPGADRRRRDTRDRSRSPVAVDRYEPGRSRDDYDRDRERNRETRRRPSPTPANIDRYIPGQDNGTPIIAKNPLKDPITLPVQVGYSLFSEWFKQNELIKEEKEFARTGKRKPISARETQEDRDREKAKVQGAYDNYKEEFQAKMARQFVAEHKKEQWFREKYVADVRDPLRQELNGFRVGNYTQWETDLDAGIFDDYSLEGIPKSESNGAGGVIEKEEGETTGANEVLGVGDLVPLKGSDIRDENAFQPTLLIKTIAPHVSRQNLEAFCKEHLGEGEGGFKWLSLSDPNPSKRYHRIGWVMLNPAPEIAPVIERPEIKDADGEVIMAAELSVPRSTADVALEAVNGKGVKDEEGGEFTVHFGVHNPPAQPRKKALWDLFSAPERVEKDLELARSLILKLESDFGSEFNAVLKIEERVEGLRSDGKIQPAVTAPSKKTKISLEDHLNEAMESGEEGEEEEEEEGAVDDEVDDEALLVKKKQLDLMVEYLRRVFNFCFFCVFESDSVHELTRKCAGGHLRRPRNTLSTAGKIAARASAIGEPFPDKKRGDAEDLDTGAMSPEAEKKVQRNSVVSKAEQQLQRAFNWVKTFETKITQILEPDNVDVRKLGGEPTEDALNRELAKYVKQEDESKFRCRVPDQDCTKLFKGENFWEKHVEKRHPEWLEGIKDHFNLVNTYVLDPAHIAPSRSDANSNGHFPQPNGFAAGGTPRGFNLQNYNGLGGMQAAAFGAGFPPFFANYPVQAPPLGWPVGSDRNGPVRRGGRTYQGSARTGPYDRRDGRWVENAVRLSPPPGGRPRGGMGGGGGRWGDGAAGSAAAVPPQAVQGRVIKSYDDLDAVAGGGSGELNY